MIGFYCATPYHLLIAIHLATTKYKDNKANIILMNHFSDAENIANKLKGLDLFDNVYLLNQSNKTYLQKIKRLAEFIIPNTQIKKFMQYDYTEMVFFANDFMNYAYIIKNFRRGKHSPFFLMPKMV